MAGWRLLQTRRNSFDDLLHLLHTLSLITMSKIRKKYLQVDVHAISNFTVI